MWYTNQTCMFFVSETRASLLWGIFTTTTKRPVVFVCCSRGILQSSSDMLSLVVIVFHKIGFFASPNPWNGWEAQLITIPNMDLARMIFDSWFLTIQSSSQKVRVQETRYGKVLLRDQLSGFQDCMKFLLDLRGLRVLNPTCYCLIDLIMFNNTIFVGNTSQFLG